MITTAEPAVRAGAISRLLNAAGLKRSPKRVYASGYETQQVGAEVWVWWTEGDDVEAKWSAYSKMHQVLAPRGYKILDTTDGSHFVVRQTDRVFEEDVLRALAKSGRCYRYGKNASGYFVEPFEGDKRFVRVSWRESAHASYQGDRNAIVFGTLGIYAAVLELAGYEVGRLKDEEAVIVGLKGSKLPVETPKPLPVAQALVKLRETVEAASPAFYTRKGTTRTSVLVLRDTYTNNPLLEVFYDEETGEYHAQPGHSFGRVRSRDLVKVVDFLLTELTG